MHESRCVKSAAGGVRSARGKEGSHRTGGLIYHVVNRTAGRFRMMRRDADFETFERVLVEASRVWLPISKLSSCGRAQQSPLATNVQRSSVLIMNVRESRGSSGLSMLASI
jgi:hypothetical protein